MSMDTEVLKTRITHTHHPEVLRQFAFLLIGQIERLQEKIADSEKTHAEEQMALKGMTEKLTQLLFKHGREKVSHEGSARSRDNRKREKLLLLHSESFAPAPTKEESPEIPEEHQYHEATDEELIEDAKLRGFVDAKRSDWEEIRGLYEESSEITVIERQYKKIRHRRKKYRLKHRHDHNQNEKTIIHTANGSEKLAPGCGYSIDFALATVADKYLWHLPLERQRRRMVSFGLSISVKRLYDLAMKVAEHLEDVVAGIRADIFVSNRALHLDETTWPIFGDHDDDGYMWVLSNQAGAYYRFEPTRSGKVIEEMLKGYRGPVLNDAYGGYNRLKRIEAITAVANCWSHARRYFYDIRENYPSECKQILDWIDELFAIERKARDWDTLEILRQTESRILVKAIYQWLIAKKEIFLHETEFTKAINYCLNHWQGLSMFLTDIRIPLSNNDAERALRHSVMGRKNFNGSKTINGADLAATFYTVIESCKRVELDPVHYMRYVIHENLKRRSPKTPLQYAKQIRSNTGDSDAKNIA